MCSLIDYKYVTMVSFLLCVGRVHNLSHHSCIMYNLIFNILDNIANLGYGFVEESGR